MILTFRASDYSENMLVLIIEKSTQRVVAQYPVTAQGQNYEPSAAEHFSLAWKCAVDDGLVRSDEREKYEFRNDDT